jgi:hypothetical protein
VVKNSVKGAKIGARTLARTSACAQKNIWKGDQLVEKMLYYCDNN